jgi:hypothetical protein
VIAFGPWTLYGGFQIANPFFLWYLMGYMIAAVLVLKQIWVRVPISDETHGTAHSGGHEFQRRLAWLSRGIVIPPRAMLTLLGLMLVGAISVVWFEGNTEARLAVVVLGTMTGVGVLLAWLAGI